MKKTYMASLRWRRRRPSRGGDSKFSRHSIHKNGIVPAAETESSSDGYEGLAKIDGGTALITDDVFPEADTAFSQTDTKDLARLLSKRAEAEARILITDSNLL